MNLSFSSNKALITGGNCDIAISLASAMIEEGLHPILTYRTDKAHDTIRNALPDQKHYSTAKLVYGEIDSLDECMISLPNDIGYFVDFVHSDYETLIGLFNYVKASEYFAANLLFRAELAKRISRMMLAQHFGRLIYISSTAAAQTNPGQGLYSITKSGSEALYRSIGIELADKGITTVSLRLGYTDSGRGKRYLEKNQATVTRLIPSKKVQSPEDISRTILFMMSDASLGINATEITIDGGMNAAKSGGI